METDSDETAEPGPAWTSVLTEAQQEGSANRKRGRQRRQQPSGYTVTNPADGGVERGAESQLDRPDGDSHRPTRKRDRGEEVQWTSREASEASTSHLAEATSRALEAKHRRPRGDQQRDRAEAQEQKKRRRVSDATADRRRNQTSESAEHADEDLLRESLASQGRALLRSLATVQPDEENAGPPLSRVVHRHCHADDEEVTLYWSPAGDPRLH